MVLYFNTEHPKDVLLFYVADQPDENAAQAVGQMLDQMAGEREWVIQPPLFVHQTEDVTDPQTGQPVITVGGVLEFYTAHGPWRERLPREVDEAHFHECRLLADRLCELSRRDGLSFHFEFHGEIIGSIENGRPDERLDRQFLGSWGAALGIHSE